LQTKQISLLNQQKYGMDEISELQKQNSDIMSRIDDLREKIKEI
jgi:peptidoglycan hydrolase CwlO-like protein